MFWRALIAFVALPGVVAFAVPATWLWTVDRRSLVRPSGLLLIAAGTAAVLWCVRDFYVRGKGTLAPWAPPRHLVVDGLYRYSRNPMYLGVLILVLGWAAAFESPALVMYAAALALAFHVRVLLGEEPRLARDHGATWQAYTRRVPRWVGPRREGPDHHGARR